MQSSYKFNVVEGSNFDNQQVALIFFGAFHC